jgi:hypothetical protein
MSQNLLTAPVYVQVPVVQVKIGEYSFGVFEEDPRTGYKRFPNYIRSLEVTKVNGKVNTYILNLVYSVTEFNDPNYFEKILSSVSGTRRIEFTYGDASMPNFLYRNEVGIITKTQSRFIEGAVIEYTITAISQAALGLSGGYTFSATRMQPSMRIWEILKNNLKYGLQDLFPGMKNLTLVANAGLIPSSDLEVDIRQYDNISVLDYLNELIALMTPDTNRGVSKGSFYVLTIVDDTTGVFGGSYFKIVLVDNNIQHPEAYQLDIGYPGSNYVFNFNVEQDENYAIMYNYQKELHPQEFVSRINVNGEYEEVYAPVISSNNILYETREDDKTWWNKITQFPIKASLTIRGLLRPAILMTYIRVNIIFFGKKHIHSGLYIITKQVDRVDGDGYKTTLNLQRIGNE